MNKNSPFYAICLAGPTGSGKTALAIELAQALDCEIINADSRQIYADFPIITAQPSAADRELVPHYLYSYLDLTQKTSAGEWARRAADIVQDITARGKIPLFVGGTGFYFQTLLHGIAQIPSPSPWVVAQVAARMHNEGSVAMHAKLALLDPSYAAQVHPNDRQRIQRALEVFFGTGRPLSWWHAHKGGSPLCQGPLYVLEVTLSKLTPLLARRIDWMIANGAQREVRSAASKCSDFSAPGWSGIGCREAMALSGEAADIETIRQAWLKSTRAYAKRQLTWFRGRKEAIWVRPAEARQRIIRDHLHESSSALTGIVP